MKKNLFVYCVLVFVYLLFVYTITRQYIADTYSHRADQFMEKGNNAAALTDIDMAISLNSKEPSYYKQRAKIYIASTVNFEEDSSTYTNLKSAALTDLLIAQELNPRNLATIRNTAPLYFFLANKDLSKQASPENYDNYYWDISKEYYLQMQKYVPNDVGVQILAAKYQKRLGQNEEYINSIETIRSLRPDLLEWYPDLL